MERKEEHTGRVQVELTEKALPIELTTELTLPDYRSEISRLLWVRPTFMPPARFIGGGKADFSGACYYHALYVGPDGALYSACHEDSYAFSVPFDAQCVDGVEMSAELFPEAVISRVTGPRKMSVRCRMHARVCGYGDKSLTLRTRGEGEDGQKILTLCDSAECARLYTGGNESFELEDLLLPEGEGEVRVVSCRGELFLPEVSAGSDVVRCRGEALFTLLLSNEGEGGGAPFAVTRKIPFEREIVLEGVTPDCHARAWGGMGEMSASVEEGKVLARGSVMLCAEAQGRECVALCRDLLLPGMHADCRFEEERLWQMGPCENRNFSVSGELPLTELGMPVTAKVIDAVADAEVKEKKREGDRTRLSGELCCHVLYWHEGEYGVADMRLPWHTKIEGEGELGVFATVPLCRAAVSHEMLRIDGEVQLAARGGAHAPTRVLCETDFTKAAATPRADIEVCYPSKQETLWEVGKRYGISPYEIADANAISGEAPGSPDLLQGISYLLIP